jgi:hypothetical protein
LVRRSASIALVCLALLAALLSGCGPGSVATPTATTEASPDTSAVIEVTASVPSVANPTGPAGTPPPTPAGKPSAATAATVQPSATRSPAPPTATPTTAASPLPTLSGGQTYKDPQLRFSFMIPSNWVQVQAAGAEVAFQSPAPAGQIPATVNVVLEKLPSASVTLDEYDQAGEANLKQQFPDYKPVSLTKVTVDNKPAYKRIYTATIAGRLLELQQVYFIDNDTAYVVSCGAPQENFAANTAIFDQISGTFKLGG